MACSFGFVIIIHPPWVLFEFYDLIVIQEQDEHIVVLAVMGNCVVLDDMRKM